VRPWPELDAKYQLSNGGGTEPIWAADGKKLFYRRRDEVVEIVLATCNAALFFSFCSAMVAFVSKEYGNGPAVAGPSL
jgi:hypothetical protein